MDVADDDRTNNTLFGNATLEYFCVCTADQLKAFTHVRRCDTLKADRSWPKNKGKIDDARNGTDCLLLRAFNSRKEVPKITAETVAASKPTDNSSNNP